MLGESENSYCCSDNLCGVTLAPWTTSPETDLPARLLTSRPTCNSDVRQFKEHVWAVSAHGKRDVCK